MLNELSLSMALLMAVAPAGAAANDPEVISLAQAPSPELKEFLGRAVERGVPLFNRGVPEACAAVYAMALEAVAASDDWGLEAQQRAYLGTMLDISAAIDDPGERAWAHRRVIDTLLSGESLVPPAAASPRTLFEFSAPDELERWRIVLDGVMGGRSTGRIEQSGDSLVFSGETSLQNNGGFSSIRAPLPADSLAGYDALRIRIKGDGRTWILGASRHSEMRGDSYWTRFDTADGEWQTVTVPITEMVRQYFGQPIPGRLQPSAVRGVEFYIYDKQAGPFQLQIDRIEGVRDGA